MATVDAVKYSKEAKKLLDEKFPFNFSAEKNAKVETLTESALSDAINNVVENTPKAASMIKFVEQNFPGYTANLEYKNKVVFSDPKGTPVMVYDFAEKDLDFNYEGLKTQKSRTLISEFYLRTADKPDATKLNLNNSGFDAINNFQHKQHLAELQNEIFVMMKDNVLYNSSKKFDGLQKSLSVGEETFTGAIPLATVSNVAASELEEEEMFRNSQFRNLTDGQRVQEAENNKKLADEFKAKHKQMLQDIADTNGYLLKNTLTGFDFVNKSNLETEIKFRHNKLTSSGEVSVSKITDSSVMAQAQIARATFKPDDPIYLNFKNGSDEQAIDYFTKAIRSFNNVGFDLEQIHVPKKYQYLIDDYAKTLLTASVANEVSNLDDFATFTPAVEAPKAAEPVQKVEQATEVDLSDFNLSPEDKIDSSKILDLASDIPEFKSLEEITQYVNSTVNEINRQSQIMKDSKIVPEELDAKIISKLAEIDLATAKFVENGSKVSEKAEAEKLINVIQNSSRNYFSTVNGISAEDGVSMDAAEELLKKIKANPDINLDTLKQNYNNNSKVKV